MTTETSKAPKPARTVLAIILPLMVVALCTTFVLTRAAARKRHHGSELGGPASAPSNGREIAAADAERTKALSGKLGLCQMPRKVGTIEVRADGRDLVFNLVDVKAGTDPEDAVRALAEFGSKAVKLYDLDGMVDLQSRGKTVYRMKGLDLGVLGDVWNIGGDATELWPPMLIDPAGGRPFPSGQLGAKNLDAAARAWTEQ